MSAIRQPAFAGQFYPENPTELSATVKKYLDAADDGDARVPKAIIAPHAGYIYSGPVAATAYKRLAPARDTITRVALLGPCHRVAVSGLALSGADAFATPLGNIKLDAPAAAKILELPQVNVFDETHKLEHSLEVHLPFLQTVLNEFTLVPLVVGETPPENIAEVLNVLWGGDETLIVISSDLSHFLDYDSAKKLDGKTSRAIQDLAPEKIARQGACGRFPVSGLLALAKQRGMSVDMVDLRNSGDTAGPKNRVVGYGSWLFFEPATDMDKAAKKTPATLVWGKNVKRTSQSASNDKNNGDKPTAVEGEEDFGAGTRALLDQHGLALVLLAAASIDHGLKHGAPLPVKLEQQASDLQDNGACFVTLKQNGQLRGCIGSPRAHRSLVQDVADNAFKAAFRDSRFPALTPQERSGLDLSIAVLSPQTPMRCSNETVFLQQLRAGRDGLIIADGHRRALFLPAVWEQLSEPEIFVQHLKRKAGMTTDHWSTSFQAWRFVTESVSIDSFIDG